MVVRHLRCHLPAQGPWLSRAPADKDSSAPGSHLCPWSADPTSEPRAAEGRPMLTCLASALGPPWTSDGPARSLPHAFGSHLPPSPSCTMASTVSRCPSPCSEPRERTKESRNYWVGCSPCPRQGLGRHHAGITELKPQITCQVTVTPSHG